MDDRREGRESGRSRTVTTTLKTRKPLTPNSAENGIESSGIRRGCFGATRPSRERDLLRMDRQPAAKLVAEVDVVVARERQRRRGVVTERRR